MNDTQNDRLAKMGVEMFFDPANHPDLDVPVSIFHTEMTFENHGAITAAEIRRRDFFYRLRADMLNRATLYAQNSIKYYMFLASVFVAGVTVIIFTAASVVGEPGKMTPDIGAVQQIMDYKKLLGGSSNGGAY